MTETTEPHLPSDVLRAIPNFDARDETLHLVSTSISKPIFNHSVRVYLFSRWLAEKEGTPLSQEQLVLLFTACVCHDLGISDDFNGPQRFEIEGADAAKKHLLTHGWPESESHKVWTAIALHTSPGIAEKIDPFTRLVRLGVLIDFSAATRHSFGADAYGAEIEELLPRLDIEQTLADAVVAQASGKEELPTKTCYPSTQKHPAGSWPGMLLRAKLENPDHTGRNPAF